MDSEITQNGQTSNEAEKHRWAEIVAQWDAFTPYATVPMFTREHAVKMLEKLEGASGTHRAE